MPAAPRQVEAALGTLGLRPDSRAQDLNVDQFVALHWELQKLQSGAAEAAARATNGAAASGA